MTVDTSVDGEDFADGREGEDTKGKSGETLGQLLRRLMANPIKPVPEVPGADRKAKAEKLWALRREHRAARAYSMQQIALGRELKDWTLDQVNAATTLDRLDRLRGGPGLDPWERALLALHRSRIDPALVAELEREYERPHGQGIDTATRSPELAETIKEMRYQRHGRGCGHLYGDLLFTRGREVSTPAGRPYGSAELAHMRCRCKVGAAPALQTHD